MNNFTSTFSVQHWLESVPQGYLQGTEYGRPPGSHEPDRLLQDERLREDALRTTTQLVLGERCALAASAGLIRCAPDQDAARFLATQALDEARHVEIFTRRMFEFGVREEDLESTLGRFANPHLGRFAETLLEQVDRGDFVAGVVGQNIVLEGMAFTVFEMLHTLHKESNPAFAAMLRGTIADERRHIGFGENHIGSLIRRHPERREAIEALQQQMTGHMLAAFGSSFSRLREGIGAMHDLRRSERAPVLRWQGRNLAVMDADALEAVLSEAVVEEFRTRLARIGLEYREPRAA